MKVIFLDSVQGVAAKGETKNVKDGYFRNFLQPRKKAVIATEAVVKIWEEKRKQMLIEKEQLKGQLEEMKRRFEGIKVKVEKKITKQGTLYGGVKGGDIANAVKAQFNVEIPAEAIIIPKQIKAVGAYDVKISLGEGVETGLQIEVVERK